MKKLSYAVLKEQGYDGYLLESAPERVLRLVKETSSCICRLFYR